LFRLFTVVGSWQWWIWCNAWFLHVFGKFWWFGIRGGIKGRIIIGYGWKVTWGIVVPLSE
jgi:hypothetical protein